MALYSDLNTVTPFSASRALDIDAVLQALANTIVISPRERMFDPTGVDVTTPLLRLKNDAAVLVIKNMIAEIVEREPRVVLDFRRTEVIIPDDRRQLRLVLRFRIPSLSDILYERTGSIPLDLD